MSENPQALAIARMKKLVKDDMVSYKKNLDTIIGDLINSVSIPIAENFDEWWKDGGVYKTEQILKSVRDNINAAYAHANLMLQVYCADQNDEWDPE